MGLIYWCVGCYNRGAYGLLMRHEVQASGSTSKAGTTGMMARNINIISCRCCCRLKLWRRIDGKNLKRSCIENSMQILGYMETGRTGQWELSGSLLQQWDDEGCCFSGPSPGHAHNVTPLQNCWHCLALDGRGQAVSLPFNPPQYRLAQPQSLCRESLRFVVPLGWSTQ